MEPPLYVIRPFSLVDSSEDFGEPGDGAAESRNRFDESGLELSLNAGIEPRGVSDEANGSPTRRGHSEAAESVAPAAAAVAARARSDSVPQSASSSVSLSAALKAHAEKPPTNVLLSHLGVQAGVAEGSATAADPATSDVSLDLNDTGLTGGPLADLEADSSSASTPAANLRRDLSDAKDHAIPKGAQGAAPPRATSPAVAQPTVVRGKAAAPSPARATVKTSVKPPRSAPTRPSPPRPPAPAVPAVSGAVRDEGTSPSESSPRDSCFVPKWQRRQQQQARPPVGPSRPSIYDRGMRSLSLAARNAEELRRQLQEEEERELTFRPEISARARSLRRDPVDRGVDQARLRKRLAVLEAPLGNGQSPGAAEPTAYAFSPRISERSAKIVRRARSAGDGCLPAGERLYREAFCRSSALAEVQAGGLAGPARAGSARRTQAEITAHVDSLLRFEAKRQEALALVRAELDQQLPGTAAAPRMELHVDPEEVTYRLTHPPSPRGRRRKVVTEEQRDCTFAPKINPSSEAVLAQARDRGLGAWFDYFAARQPAAPPAEEGAANGTDVVARVSVEGLCMQKGECAEVAWYIASVLEARGGGDSGERRWTRDAFVEALREHEQRHRGQPQFWRDAPPGPTSPSRTGADASGRTRGGWPEETTFRPALNPRSEALARGRPEARAGPAYARLFHSAQRRQLQERQHHLEEMQRRLAEEAAMQERRALSNARWRALHPPRKSQELPAESDPPAGVGAAKAEQHPRSLPGESRGEESTRSITNAVSLDADGREGAPPPNGAVTAHARQRHRPQTGDAMAASRTYVSRAKGCAGLPSPPPLNDAGPPPADPRRPRSPQPVAESQRTPARGGDTPPVLAAMSLLESVLAARSPSPVLSIQHELSYSPSPLASPHTARVRVRPAARGIGAVPGEPHPRSTPSAASSSHHHPGGSSCGSSTRTRPRPVARAAPPGVEGLHPESMDVLLTCAACRDPATVPSYARAGVIRENRRRLTELGMALYRRQQKGQ